MDVGYSTTMLHYNGGPLYIIVGMRTMSRDVVFSEALWKVEDVEQFLVE